ncbi:hypothetical protein ACIQLJ_07470 [Microbacterium sp. NPDC091313]
MIRRPRLLLLAAVCGAAVAGACGIGVAAAAAGSGQGEGDTVALADIVAGWPSGFTVEGSKSEPLYTEHIRIERDGDDLRLRIDVVGQGDEAFGTQQSAVRVGASGAVAWTQGCTKPAAACADDTALRGFLTTAALLGLAREGRLPADGVRRDVHGTAAVCVDDAALHPDAAPAPVRLDTCFDMATGAVLAHWSPDSSAFVGATLAPGFTVTPRS